MTKLKREPLEQAMEQLIEPYLEAESGDLRRLADMIERGEPLPEDQRKMIAEYLRGNNQAPSRRKRSQQRREAAICYRVFEHMEKGVSKYVAIKAVEKETPNLNEETIKNYLRNWKRDWEQLK